MGERALMPDYLRLAALFGIVVVNVAYMAFPIDQGFAGATQRALIDDVAVWLVNGLATLKTYGLFSFMFGVGLAFQLRSAERRGLPFGALYRNRMIGLALFGLVHACLFFPGDILVIYAVTGSALYFWRDWPVARLARLGAMLLVAQLVVASGIVWAWNFVGGDPNISALERELMTEGGWLGAVAFRSVAFAFVFPFGLVFQGISALGWFCLGLAAVKSGMIDQPDHPLWAQARRLCLWPGVALSLAASAIMVWRDPVIGEILVIIAAPLATLGYLGLIAAWARPPSPAIAPLLAAGGSSLSIYLGQSMLLSTVFASYGLNLWDGVGPAIAVGLALGVTVGLIGALALWRVWFALGPFEWALRRISRIGVRRSPPDLSSDAR